MKFLFEKLRNLLIKDLKVWGVRFESELPPEFIITEHALQRMKERFKCDDKKIKKVVIKAWSSKQVLPKRIKDKLLKKDNMSKTDEILAIIGLSLWTIFLIIIVILLAFN